MDGKQVVPSRDDKEVDPLDYSDKEAISTSEKEVVVIGEIGIVDLPVVKSLDVFHITDDEKEIRDHNTNETKFTISREVKKNLIRSNEHQIKLIQSARANCVASAKILAKNGEIKIANSTDGPWQGLQSHQSSYSFSVDTRQLSWQPAAIGAAFGQFKLIDTTSGRPLALWKTADSNPGQIATIDWFESIADFGVETLSLVTIFAIEESNFIAANRDDDKGGNSRKFNGVDPGNSMGMGGVGGGGMM